MQTNNGTLRRPTSLSLQLGELEQPGTAWSVERAPLTVCCRWNICCWALVAIAAYKMRFMRANHMWRCTDYDVCYMDTTHWWMHAVTHTHSHTPVLTEHNADKPAVFQSCSNSLRGRLYNAKAWEQTVQLPFLNAVRVRANQGIKSNLIWSWFIHYLFFCVCLGGSHGSSWTSLKSKYQ